jgi:23S rRNA (guanosine2251-2'-O)-methyltransferase
MHQGAVALVGALRYASEEQVLEGAGDRPFLLVLDQIQDPQNLGALVRSAAAAGVHGVFLTDRGAAAPTASAHRAAAGAMDRVRLARASNVASLLERLKERGIWTVGLDPAGEPLWGGFDLTLPLALVVGAEGKGLRRLVRERCEVVLGIPMPGGGGSLNVSSATAVALFEVVRRRQNS